MARVDTFKLKGQFLDARYHVESVVGEGGFGVVYRATQINFDEPVAIKVLKIPGQLNAEAAQNFIQTFRAEGKHLRKLSSEHPAFVRAHDTGIIDVDGMPAPYLVLEWLDGVPLEDELAERRKKGEQGRSIEESMTILEPIFGALAHAHAQRVAHRDVKPANIFMARTKQGITAKLLDFGMAKVMTASGTQGLHAATQGGMSGLTPAYAAPEQWDKKMSATGPWTDVYALALVLVELLTDQPPLDGDDMPSLMAATLDEEIRPTPTARGATVEPEIEAIFAKALAFHAKDRYRHAGEFWNALVEASPIPVGAGANTQQTLVKIVMPAGDVLQPDDFAPEVRPSAKPSKTKSKASSDANSDAITVAAPHSVSSSSSSTVTGKTQTHEETKEDRTIVAPAEGKKSSNLPMIVLLAAIVVLGIFVWKWQPNGTPEPTNATTTLTAPSAEATPSTTAKVEKPKKKNRKWWEELPDATDATDDTAKEVTANLSPARQKWLTLRDKSESLGAEKKRDEAVTTLRTALELACKELGQDDPACAATMQLLARLLAQMGKLGEAEELLREAIKLNAQYGDADDEEFDDSRQALIAILLKQGKDEEAKEFWKPTDAPLPAPKTSASAAPSAAPQASGSFTARPATAAPPEDTRDPWTQILEEIKEEKASAKKPPAKNPDAKP